MDYLTASKFLNSQSIRFIQFKSRIQFYEIQLSQTLNTDNANLKKLNDALEVLEKIISLYESLLHRITHLPAEKCSLPGVIPQKDRQSLCVRLKVLTDDFHQENDKTCLVIIISELLGLYQQLQISLSSDVSRLNVNSEPRSVDHANFEWLNYMVLYNHECARASIDLNAFLKEKLTLQEKNALKNICHEKFINPLLYAIHNCKQNPTLLLSTNASADEIVCLQQKLTWLFKAIEAFKSFLFKDIQLERGHETIHLDALPEGVFVTASELHIQVISDVTSRLKRAHDLSVSISTYNIWLTIFDAYQFWFNPCRLIDAVMLLQQFFSRHVTCTNISLSHYLCQELDLLTTNECLMLYGYFSNKETNYLMRTLCAISRGLKIEPFQELKIQDINALKEVQLILCQVREAVRAALKQRHIQSNQYFTSEKYPKPGKRIKKAINHILSVYPIDQIISYSQIFETIKILEDD